MVMQTENGVEHSSRIRIYGDAAFSSQINAGGEFEATFDDVVTLTLTLDAAEILHARLDEALPGLRRFSENT